MGFKTVRDFDLKDKRVILRADLNVPAEDGKVTDTTRIDRLKITIDYLHNAGAKIVVVSHLGRPKGPSPELSLKFLVPVLEKQWQAKIAFSEDCIGDKAKASTDSLKSGEIVLFENLRFHAGEENDDSAFAKALAANGDIFVNDAFSVSHRKAASLVGITQYLPAAAGLLMEEELTALDKAVGNPQKPVAAIVGGSKISTKLDVLNSLVTKVDYLVLGGAMANTFLHARGINIGGSMCEKDMAEQALAIAKIAEDNGCDIVLPIDGVTVTELKENADHKTITVADGIPADRRIVDVGPESIQYIKAVLDKCKTAVWNGPLGVFEKKPFDCGTSAVAQHVAQLTKQGKIASIGGGGDTVSALNNAGVEEDFTYVSTAGGAFLEYLEGKKLPGVAAL